MFSISNSYYVGNCERMFCEQDLWQVNTALTQVQIISNVHWTDTSQKESSDEILIRKLIWKWEIS